MAAAGVRIGRTMTHWTYCRKCSASVSRIIREADPCMPFFDRIS